MKRKNAGLKNKNTIKKQKIEYYESDSDSSHDEIEESENSDKIEESENSDTDS